MLKQLSEKGLTKPPSDKDFKKFSESIRHLNNPVAYSEKHELYDNIYLLNGYNETKYLHKYITYNSFIEFVEKNMLIFVSPILWTDPFEHRFLNTDYSKYHYKKPEIACMCTTRNISENEDAAWKIYINNQKEKGLRIRLNVVSLFSQLDKYAKENNCKIYIGEINYEFDRKEIEELHTDKNTFFKNQFFTNPFTNDNYLSLLCLKRKSYKYENEIRIFIVSEEKILNHSKRILSIPIDIKSVIDRAVIAPLPPFNKLDPRFSEYYKIDEIERKSFYKMIKKILPSCEIFSSTLYKCNLLEKA